MAEVEEGSVTFKVSGQFEQAAENQLYRISDHLLGLFLVVVVE